MQNKMVPVRSNKVLVRSSAERLAARKPAIEMLESRTMLSADLALSVVGPANVTAGTNATYIFTTVNNGKGTANGILYTVPVGFPAGCSQVSFTSTTGPATKLAPGQSQTYTLVLKVDASVPSATVLNFPELVNTKGEINPADNTATISTPVISSADLNIVVSGPAKVTRGNTVTFTISTVNAGPSLEPTGLYTPPSGFPAGLSQVSFTTISGPGFSLPPGSQSTFAVVMLVDPSVANGTVLSFPAVLTGGIVDPNQANNTATVSTTVVSQTVLPVTVGLTSSSFNSTSNLGDLVSFTAAVTAVTPGGATPTGTVTFTSDGTALGTVPVASDGTATLPASSDLADGYHTIIASYSGDATYVATTRSITQVVNTPIPSTVIPIFGKVTLPTAVVSGANFKASLPVGFTNNGSKQDGIFSVTLFANTTSRLDGNQVQIAAPVLKHFTLLTNRHGAFPLKLSSLPSSLPSGTYHIIAQIKDANGLFNEVATTQTITTAAPFVTLAATTTGVLPAAIAAGKSGSITISVTNNGNIDATGPLSVSVAPSIDQVTAVTGVTVATLSKPTATIKVGKTVKYTLHFKNLAPLTPGRYFPIATISIGGKTATVTGTSSFVLS